MTIAAPKPKSQVCTTNCTTTERRDSTRHATTLLYHYSSPKKKEKKQAATTIKHKKVSFNAKTPTPLSPSLSLFWLLRFRLRLAFFCSFPSLSLFLSVFVRSCSRHIGFFLVLCSIIHCCYACICFGVKVETLL